mmetsp:Transcript_40691/g.93506  ORF Transcript_40691/g.93506 Transcript_40691/m.93506 type:complete len:103 (+) Transcript_40691:439-747(+)
MRLARLRRLRCLQHCARLPLRLPRRRQRHRSTLVREAVTAVIAQQSQLAHAAMRRILPHHQGARPSLSECNDVDFNQWHLLWSYVLEEEYDGLTSAVFVCDN